MSLICSCCQSQKFTMLDITFEIPKREKSKAVGIVCDKCNHTQEIMSIESLTIPIESSKEGSLTQMRAHIDTTSDKRKKGAPQHQQPSAVDQAILQALKQQNLNVTYDASGLPSIIVLDKKKPILKNYIPNDIKITPSNTNLDDPTTL